MTRSVEVFASFATPRAKRRKSRAPLQWKFYRGYPYLRVSPLRLRLSNPDGTFLCHIAGPRALVRYVNLEIRRRQLAETLPMFREAA